MSEEESKPRTPHQKWQVFIDTGVEIRERGIQHQMQQANSAFSQAIYTAGKNGLWDDLVGAYCQRALIPYLQFTTSENPNLLTLMRNELVAAECVAAYYPEVTSHNRAVIKMRIGQYFLEKGDKLAAFNYLQEAINLLPIGTFNPEIHSHYGLLEILTKHDAHHKHDADHGMALLDHCLASIKISSYEEEWQRLGVLSGIQLRRAVALNSLGNKKESQEALSEASAIAIMLMVDFSRPWRMVQTDRIAKQLGINKI
jgi:hypothetical protein